MRTTLVRGGSETRILSRACDSALPSAADAYKYPVQLLGDDDLMAEVGGEVMAKSYVFLTPQNIKIWMREEIIESKFAFEVPCQLLSFALKWQNDAIQVLERARWRE
jgi:hypothetical protein